MKAIQETSDAMRQSENSPVHPLPFACPAHTTSLCLIACSHCRRNVALASSCDDTHLIESPFTPSAALTSSLSFTHFLSHNEQRAQMLHFHLRLLLTTAKDFRRSRLSLRFQSDDVCGYLQKQGKGLVQQRQYLLFYLL